MGHRVELHRRLYPIMGYRLDGSVHDHQLALLGIPMKALPVGTAYSIWVGVGAIGTVALESCWLESP
jgi:quaternary ammonium compound-resistance protein SugE